MADNVVSVSYTHLDVYKRQQHGCGLGHVRRLPVPSGRYVADRMRAAHGVSVLPLSLIHI